MPTTQHARWLVNGARFYIGGRPYLDEPYHLKGVGLPNIYLLNGVIFENDPDYGELITIENLEGLLRTIGLHIVEKCEPMTGAELRFLRKQMEHQTDERFRNIEAQLQEERWTRKNWLRH